MILNIHLISDFSIYALKGAISSSLIHFPNIACRKHYWPLVKNDLMLDKICSKIKIDNGMVLYNISNKFLRKSLRNFCDMNNIPNISLVGKIVEEISDYLGIEAEDMTEWRETNNKYYNKLSAIEFAVAHDDGQNIQNIINADVILIGPSRSSKTPTSFYLAYHGLKTANIPYIRGHDMDQRIFTISSLIVVFVLDHIRLAEIRRSRIGQNHYAEVGGAYLDSDLIREECREVRMLAAKHNWPVIDVTAKSVEETASIISKFFYEK